MAGDSPVTHLLNVLELTAKAKDKLKPVVKEEVLELIEDIGREAQKAIEAVQEKAADPLASDSGLPD